ncbi:hypothetical protein KJ966_30830 [bacterium]|nr:hypothetical protein [bacterium]
MKKLVLFISTAILMLSLGSVQASENSEAINIYVNYNIITAEIQFVDQVYPCQYSWQIPPSCR